MVIGPQNGGYTGFTGGLQFKYRLWGDVSLFAEPRTSLASYSLKTNEKEEGRYVAQKVHRQSVQYQYRYRDTAYR